jgi:cytoskeletal protein CcmA (bactofilin family)
VADAPETKDTATGTPAPEVLKPQADDKTPAPEAAKTDDKAKDPKATKRPRHVTFRPSHKATFIGLTVVILILAINAAVIVFVTKSQNKTKTGVSQDEVTLSTGDLEKLGVSRNPVGNLGTELVVGPDSKFNGKLTVASDVSIAGQLRLNSKFSASEASLTKLDAGNTSLEQLNVNGDGTVSTLTLRKDLSVAGLTRLQGPVTLTQLLTVNNNVNITGGLSVGGTLSARSFQASSLVSDTTLTIGGHVITRGTAPGISSGPAVGSNGTVSISGSDTAGTVAVNVGTGGGNGLVASISFRNRYDGTPHVVITPIGLYAAAYVNRTATGFTISVSGVLAPGGYAFDYFVTQ